MLCPECNHPLHTISLQTDTSPITADYCQNCAGVWFDRGESNFLKEHHLEPLKQVLPQQTNHPEITSRFCPKDHALLEVYTGENVPREITLYHCLTCDGMWFPEGTVFTFKKAQEAKINYFKAWNIPLTSVYAVLLPMFVLLVLGGGLLTVLYGVNQSTEQRTKAYDLISKPAVFYPDKGQVMVSFTTQNATTTRIEYWITADTVTTYPISDVPATQHSIVLSDLESGRTYLYQLIITAEQEIRSPIYTFSPK